MSKSPLVIVGMSGGVDSSVAALKLLEKGYRVEGLFMKNWNEDDGTEYCTAREDLLDAMQVAGTLGIELHTVNFAAAYWDRVFTHFLDEYRAGRTPNPDILCNKEIKFCAFLDHARTLGADFIATGHYARVAHREDGGHLLRAADTNKDQTYFLHAVKGTEFAGSLFPLGDMEKTEVRKLAEKAGFANHAKKDSTGICFIGERRFSDFLKRYLPAQPGDIVDESGKAIGQHDGLMYYTIGQRQGIGIGGRVDSGDSPWYVAGKDLDNNLLVVVQGQDHPLLFKQELIAVKPDWVIKQPTLPKEVTAKIRYRQADQKCNVTTLSDGKLKVAFSDPQRAVTPGQSVVFYSGEECLGGAIIE
jgi:tRNA-specific 2-thiouridylase